ncbi:MAG: hypothetical protein ACXAD7_28480, partial [Candidatus Kariarchaeaceae archaeon]
KKLITKFARPKPLFKPNQVIDYFLLSSTLKTAISRIGISSNFSHCIIKSDQYCIASVYSGKNISIAIGSPNTPKNTVLNVALEMCRFDSLHAFIGEIKEKNIRSSASLTHEGVLNHLEGEELPSMVSVFLLTAINNINMFSKLTTNRNFVKFSLFLKNGLFQRLEIERKGTTEEFIIQIIDYS